MKRPYLAWYVLALVLALAPAGLRVLLWPPVKPHAADAAMVRAGQTLFTHVWKANDPLANGGDGLGPVFNAASCVACHHKGGLGGSGGLEHNVTTFVVKPLNKGDTPREGVIHAAATKIKFR